jgi:hypothetical protein
VRRGVGGRARVERRLRVVLDPQLHRLGDVLARDPRGERSAMSMPDDTPADVTTLPCSTTRSNAGSAP